MVRSRRPRLPRRTEASIEDACVRYVTERGWLARKMNGLGFRSWPDRLMIPPRTRSCGPIWVEFKRPGKELTVAQAELCDDLEERGELVLRGVDSLEKFRALIEEIG